MAYVLSQWCLSGCSSASPYPLRPPGLPQCGVPPAFLDRAGQGRISHRGSKPTFHALLICGLTCQPLLSPGDTCSSVDILHIQHPTDITHEHISHHTTGHTPTTHPPCSCPAPAEGRCGPRPLQGAEPSGRLSTHSGRDRPTLGAEDCPAAGTLHVPPASWGWATGMRCAWPWCVHDVMHVGVWCICGVCV